MRSHRGTWAATAASLLLLTTGCAGTGTGGPSGPSSAPAAPAEPGEAPVLRVENVGGFVDPAAAAVRVPSVSIYADGRVITPGPVLMIYPGPALPNIQVQRIPADSVPGLVDRAVAAGVGAAADHGRPGLADAPTTRFTVLAGGQRRTTDVYALAEATPELPGLTPEQRTAREKLTALLLQLTDLTATLGEGKISAAQPYTAHAVVAVAGPWQKPQEDGVSPPPAQAWPGPALPGKPVGADQAVGCVTATGDAATAVLAAAKDAKQTTPWTAADRSWQVWFRPLLPDEVDCDSLRERR
jgi:hypothetical protein